MIERRLEARLDDAELATVTWQQQDKTYQQLGNVENLSLTGAGMILEFPVFAGTSIAMEYGSGTLNGIVRRCDPQQDRYFVGVEFVGTSRGFQCFTDTECDAPRP